MSPLTIDPSSERYDHPISVSPGDIDRLGHVNNVVYVRWVQDSAVAHWNSSADPEHRKAIAWVVVRLEIDYLRSAVLGDELIGRTWVGTAEKNIFERHTEILRKRDMKVLARARSMWCPVDHSSLKPIRVGPDIHARWSVPKS